VKVLLADNSTLVRERLASLLSELDGIEAVRQASTAGETLGNLQELRPDVVILDVNLTKDDGLDVLREIKARAAAPVVIVLSTFPYPQYQRRCARLGADFFLDKATEIHRVSELIALIGDSRDAPSTHCT
jgi:DNA-binding NarL/FixJ family response regulator